MTNYGSPRSTKEPARISGNVVIAKVSGEVISVSGIVVIVSSVVIHTEVSGSWVSVSGSAVTISGQSIFIVPSYTIEQSYDSGAGALNFSHSSTSPKRTVVDCITYHATSGTTTSSELVVTLQYGGTSSAFFTKVFSVNMATDTVSDIYWVPQTEVWLVSGDAINVKFSNPDTCAYGAMIRVRQL